MLDAIERKMDLLIQNNCEPYLKIGLVGIEKESLRVNKQGAIAQSDHPRHLGSSLTHPYITTDYSEALLEFVTPPLPTVGRALQFLEEIHQFVYPNMTDECLWPASMPCRLNGEQSIRIAEYGNSNLGKMKNVYRRGLGYRYGKVMQVIAGIHINMSMPDEFWAHWHNIIESSDSLQEFINHHYFCLIRNLQRIGWLIPYLFGASPAVDRSFSHKGVSELQEWNSETLYNPDATSLRLGDIGYTNHRENEIGVKACYDSLPEYVKCLTRAIETPYAPYEEIGIKVHGEYRQLNANILQIENEYYSTVRPKQVTKRIEKPTRALTERGVQYVEIRSLDLNPFTPYGISIEQLKFMEVLFIYCLLGEEALIDRREREEIDINEYEVAHHGRRKHLQLRRRGESISLQQWAKEIFIGLQLLAEHMDKIIPDGQYSMVIKEFGDCVNDVNKTLSASMLTTMRKQKLSYYQFVASLAEEYCKLNSRNTLSEDILHTMDQEVQESILEQKRLEQENGQSFDQFLEEYFAQ